MLTPGTRLGPYDIKALIGQGGMGEVYRARDTKLNRDVAIKILGVGFTTDPDRLARFDREATTLASLNHPNIASIHGVEDAGPTRAIVMELVEGEDLSQRIARGPMAIAEALAIARQIADAVQTAHDHGVIHRDLKPANVKVKPGGTVKLLDFGLAKVAEGDTAHASLTHSPTVMTSMPGTLLGTAAYMSPEQAKGHTADARSDVWAFGCLLFEMLSGRSAFGAPTASEILANVLTKEPEWQHLPQTTPLAVRRLLRRCLEKNEANRLRAIADARLEIDDAQTSNDAAAPPRTAARFRRERLAWTGAVALLGVMLVALGISARRRPPAAAEVRFDISTPDVDPNLLPSVSLSADGRRLLFLADADGQPHVWVRELDSVAARPVAGTGGATSMFWSPDGRSLAFYADGFLRRLDFDGGLVRTLAKVTVGLIGGTWSRDGVILFVRNPASAIARVSADGGPVVDVTRLGTGQVGHAFPHFLPDGKHFLYFVTAAPDSRGIYLSQIDGSSSRRLIDADAGGVYTNGHVLFVRETRVFAQAFDPDRLELRGSPFQVADGIFNQAGGFTTTVSASAGAFAFRAGAARFSRQFTWVDRSGKEIATVADRLGNPDGVSFSPDRSQLVFFERGTRNSQLWMLDIRRGLVSRFTDDTDEDIFPLWTRDGNGIIYSAIRNGQLSLYLQPVGSGQRELVIQPQSDELFASDTSPDGRYIVFQRMNAKTGWDVWALPREPNATPISIVQTDADERSARLSPDGRWMAFVSNTSGVFEVYVQPFPGPGRRLQVSSKGGEQIHWRADGAELFYIARDGKLMATPIKPAADRQSLEIGTPVPLFVAQVPFRPFLQSDYMASSDGQRFLVNRILRDAGGTPLRVVLNWAVGR